MCMYILYLDILICKNSQRIVGVKGLVSILVSRYVRMSQLADTKKKPSPTCSSLPPPGVCVCVGGGGYNIILLHELVYRAFA
jgi:hypothetical protein